MCYTVTSSCPEQDVKRLKEEGGVRVKQYTLTAVIDGETISFSRKFASRSEAIDYAFNYYSKHFYKYIQVEDEFCINDNIHDVEYVCDYGNRFRINRVSA